MRHLARHFSAAAAVLAVLAPGASAAAVRGIYGTAWNADGLANVEIGKFQGQRLDIRFRARHDGAFAGVKTFLIFGTSRDISRCSPTNCYGAGDGGRLRVELHADNGSSRHLPATRVLASMLVTDPMNTSPRAPIFGVNHAAFRLFGAFDVAPRLRKGVLYHLVFRNVAANPARNYVSLDTLYVRRGRKGVQPGQSDTDLAMLVGGRGGRWKVRYTGTPIFEVRYRDGASQGNGYVDVRWTSPQRIGGSAAAAERITVHGADRLVSSIHVRLARNGAPGALSLRIAAGATTVGACSVPAGSVPRGQAWVACLLAAPRVLRRGRTYRVIVSAPGGSGSYGVYGLREGGDWGFGAGSVFRDGHAEYDDGSGWRSEISGWGDLAHYDYQLYLTS